MTTTERASLITDLYAIRAACGVAHTRAIQEFKNLSLAASCAVAREAMSDAINLLQNETANGTATFNYPATAQEPATPESGTAPR